MDIIIYVFLLVLGFISIFRPWGMGAVFAGVLFLFAFLISLRSYIFAYYKQYREQHRFIVKSHVTRDFILILVGVVFIIAEILL